MKFSNCLDLKEKLLKENMFIELNLINSIMNYLCKTKQINKINIGEINFILESIINDELSLELFMSETEKTKYLKNPKYIIEDCLLYINTNYESEIDEYNLNQFSLDLLYITGCSFISLFVFYLCNLLLNTSISTLLSLLTGIGLLVLYTYKIKPKKYNI